MHFYRKCWFGPFKKQFISPFMSDCPSLMLGIAIHCILHSQAMLERGVCELAHSFFHLISLQLPHTISTVLRVCVNATCKPMDENALNIRQNQDNLKTKIQITLKLKSSKHSEFIFKRALWVYITNFNINIFNVLKNMYLTRFFKL